MVAFKLLLSLALVSVALARDMPQFPRATVNLSTEGLEMGSSSSSQLRYRVGEPFLLTCTFDPTLPEDDPQSPSMNGPWTAEVSFGIIKSMYDFQVFGTYKMENQCDLQYVTENFFPGVNVYPVTEVEPGMGGMGQLRTNYTVEVLATEEYKAQGEYRCSVKLFRQYRKAAVKFFSNKIYIA